MDRYYRGIQQDIRIVGIHKTDNFILTVRGTTGKLYDVTLDSNAFVCTCPDYKIRALGLGGRFDPNPDHVCKHIYFVLSKILKLDSQVVKSYTPAKCEVLYQQVSYLLNKLSEGLDPEPMFEEETAIQRDIEEDDFCPICFEDFTQDKVLDMFEPETIDKPIVYCKASCGKSVHEECMKTWLQHNSTCIYCRAVWIDY